MDLNMLVAMVRRKDEGLKSMVRRRKWCERSQVFSSHYPIGKNNLLRHNLDVMYIKKNVVDNIIGTLLDMKGKTKDNHETGHDLRKMGLRVEIHHFTSIDGKTYPQLASQCLKGRNMTF
jgi:hypothetical protein